VAAFGLSSLAGRRVIKNNAQLMMWCVDLENKSNELDKETNY
jgi:hypothetical protein